jgi:hypothetical protein
MKLVEEEAAKRLSRIIFRIDGGFGFLRVGSWSGASYK